ncbi:MAG: aminopeptidase P family protein [Thermoplasmata archaeon]|nr:aminopeptidase P family protein [Thermoplasmata archaeon]
MLRKIKRLFDMVGVDTIIIKNASMPFIDENFFYFTGREGVWEESIAVVKEDGVFTISSPLEEGDYVYKTKEERDRILRSIVEGRVGVNEERLSHKDYSHLKKLFGKLHDIGKEIKLLRAVKEREEINKIKKAVRIAKSIADEVDFHGKGERDVKADIECMMLRHGVKPSFDTIVAFGKNSSKPHHVSSNKKFTYPVLIDLGTRYKNYCSDITITHPGRHLRKYEVIHDALMLAIDLMEPGTRARDVFLSVDRYLSRYGIKMIHALGHSIGINVHDGLAINSRADFVFEENMTFAVEPACYCKNFGIRIEEDVVIGKRKARIIL